MILDLREVADLANLLALHCSPRLAIQHRIGTRPAQRVAEKGPARRVAEKGPAQRVAEKGPAQRVAEKGPAHYLPILPPLPESGDTAPSLHALPPDHASCIKRRSGALKILLGADHINYYVSTMSSTTTTTPTSSTTLSRP